MKKLYKLHNNIRYYSFDECLNYLNEVGKEKFGDNFRIYNRDKLLVYKLLIYFIQEVSECEKYKINLKKGILLIGPVGCGKTTLMTLVRDFTVTENKHVMKPTRDVAFEFIADGFATITKYGKTNKVYCFDDLGLEKNIKHFGNECNTMAEILLSRYDMFIHFGILTHITTNLNSEEIEKMYGNRVRSRLREMFNLITFEQNAQDKRK